MARQSRAERERAFRLEHGVSSGTYYEMRRKAAARGIDPKQFDTLGKSAGYKTAKALTQVAAKDPRYARLAIEAGSKGVSTGTMRQVYDAAGYGGMEAVAAAPDTKAARYEALNQTGYLDPHLSLADFDDSMDIDLPDDFDWYYH